MSDDDSDGDFTVRCPFCCTRLREDSRGRCRECGADETDELRRRKRSVAAELRALGCFGLPWVEDPS